MTIGFCSMSRLDLLHCMRVMDMESCCHCKWKCGQRRCAVKIHSQARRLHMSRKRNYDPTPKKTAIQIIMCAIPVWRNE